MPSTNNSLKTTSNGGKPAMTGNRTSWQSLFAVTLAVAIGVGGLTAYWEQQVPDSPVVAVAEETTEAVKIDLAAAAVDKANTLGFPTVKGGDFKLVDQFGQARTSKSGNGQHQLVFFGYAKCKAICTAAFPTMAEAVDTLERSGVSVTPVLITVDPERDTVAALREAAPLIHPRMVGLTGGDDALAVAYKAFGVEKKFNFNHIDEGPIYSHGSFVYLLGPDGEFKTLFPPILGATRIVEITAGYIAEAS
jgi:protein SCO1/2